MPAHVVSIHDAHPGGDLAVDLRDVLEALGDAVAKSEWVATLLDCSGEKVQPLCDEVEAARPAGVKLDGARLLAVAEEAGVTNDAILFGYPAGSPDLAKPRHLRAEFLGSDAQLLVESVEGAFFVVAAKEKKLIERVRERFEDVRDEDVEASW